MSRFIRYLQTYYNLSPEDVRPTGVRGYWEIIEPCGGQGVCRHPLHQTMFNDGPVRHTIEYRDPSRDSCGRFCSPFQTWKKEVAGLALTTDC